MENPLQPVNKQTPGLALAQSNSPSERMRILVETIMESMFASLPPVKRFLAKQFLDNVGEDMMSIFDGVTDEQAVQTAKTAKEMAKILFDAVEHGVDEQLKNRIAEQWGELRGIQKTAIEPDARD